jgi:nitrite reductase/ring-hydroxylating ferredoxin subunit
MPAFAVARVSEIPPGQRKIVELVGRSIGVFNVGGHFYAVRNQCPHQGAPLCRGSIQGTAAASLPGEYRWEREGEILRCPWHGWEFDITSGRSVFNPHKVRVRRYDVTLRVDDEDEERVDTYSVSITDGVVVLHI